MGETRITAQTRTKEGRNRLVARWALQALASVGTLTQSEWAEIAGISRGLLSKQLSGNKPLHIQALLAAPEVGREWVRQAAAHLGLLAIEAPQSEGSALDHFADMASFGKESGEALGAYGKALEDQRVDPEEARQIEGELDDVIRVACRLRERARRIGRAEPGTSGNVRPLHGKAVG